jgi:hypothetical protein
VTGDGRGGGEDPQAQELGDGLRGRLDVGGIGLGVGAGLNRPAGWGQWERPAGRLLGGGQPVGGGFLQDSLCVLGFISF